MGTYGLSRPAAESLFTQTNGKEALPYVWLLVAAASFVVVSLYNRFAANRNLMRTYAVVAIASAVVLAALLAARGLAPLATSWALYVWKDIYIILLVEIFWSYANSVFDRDRARRTYGIFLLAGEIGAIAGGLAAQSEVGTLGDLWSVAPVLVVVGLGALWIAPRLPAPAAAAPTPATRREASWSEGFRVLRGSRYLLLLLVLIGTTQVVITVLDFEFNAVMLASLPDMDERKQFTSAVYIAVNALSITLMLGAPWILARAGAAGVLLAVPLILGASVVAFAAMPALTTVAVMKVMSKGFDYSIFRAAKELLYLPLSYVDKTQGKALIDMLTYRFAKAGASLLLIALADVAGAAIGLTLLLLLVWIVDTALLVRRYGRMSATHDATAAVG